MAGYSEPDDPYAADVETSASASAASNRRQRSLRNREYGLFANRLRQRPTTKQEPASEVPGQPLAQNRRLQAAAHRKEEEKSEDGGDSDYYYCVDEESATDAVAPQLPPIPLSPISPRWASFAGSVHSINSVNTTGGSGGGSDQQYGGGQHHNSNHHQNQNPPSPYHQHHHQYHQHHQNHPYQQYQPYQQQHSYRDHSATSSVATTATTPLTPTSPSSIHSPPILSPPPRKRPSASASRFAGLSSHPVYPSDPTAHPDRPSVPLRELPLRELPLRELPLPEEDDDISPGLLPPSSNSAANSAAVLAAAPTTSSSRPSSRPSSRLTTDSRPSSSRPSSSRRAAEEAMLVENFSRPRKASIRQTVREVPSRPSKYDVESPISNPAQAAWPRTRGPSVSSSRSAATLASLNARPSNDHLNASYRAPRAAQTVTAPASSVTSGGMISPGLPRPQMAYNRVDGAGSIPSSSTHTHAHPSTREKENIMPWIADEEPRSSYRSQLTTSTAPGTMFTTAGTERSSVLTKTSSRTSASLYGYGAGSAAEDGGLSLEDVMGMYEKGFVDSTGPEDNDLETDARDEDAQDAQDVNTLGHGASETSKSGGDNGQNVGNRILEAMSEPLPIPNKGTGLLRKDDVPLVRDSGAFFRKSGLPSSLPNDIGLGPTQQRELSRRERQDKDESTRSKHDSAKLLDGDEQSSLRRRPSQQGGGRTSPSSPAMSTSNPDLPEHEQSTEQRQQPQQQEQQQQQQQQQEEESEEESDQASPTAAAPPLPSQLFSAPTNEDPETRDRYGFRKHNQYISREQYDSWNSSYTEYLARRRRKWMAYLKDSGLMTENPNRFPAPSAKTKRFIRKGIPPEWRGAAWFYYARGPTILARHAGVYNDLVARSQRGESKEVDAEAIERDLHRTFPDNARFRFSAADDAAASSASETSSRTDVNVSLNLDEKGRPRAAEPPIISSLRRVLHAFAIYNPRIGYCQSLNFLAGLLLLFVETEEQVFWLLNIITRVHLPGTHEMSLEGSKVDLGVLMGAVKDSMPGVWSKVGGELEGDSSHNNRPGTQSSASAGGKKSKTGGGGRRPKAGTVAAGTSSADRLPPITLCMTAWFMSCFIGTLPIETTLRVWDVFFYEGSRTLFRIALAIFKLGEPEIRAVQDPMEMFGVVQALPRRLLDCNAVMEATFRRRNGFGHLSQEAVEERRAERRAELVAAANAAAATATASQGGGTVRAGRGGRAADDARLAAKADIADLAGAEVDTPAAAEMRRKGTLFGRRKERGWAAEV